MTDNRTLPVADLLESLDFQPQCYAESCEHPALWIARMKCCTVMDLMCNMHRALSLAWFVRNPVCHCSHCSRNFMYDQPILWEPLR
jgi:hypothetical protein